MTTAEEFCQMLILVGAGVPIHLWPRHRRGQFMRVLRGDREEIRIWSVYLKGLSENPKFGEGLVGALALDAYGAPLISHLLEEAGEEEV